MLEFSSPKEEEQVVDQKNSISETFSRLVLPKI